MRQLPVPSAAGLHLRHDLVERLGKLRLKQRVAALAEHFSLRKTVKLSRARIPVSNHVVFEITNQANDRFQKVTRAAQRIVGRAKMFLGPFAFRDVDDGGENEISLSGADWIEADLDRYFAAVL